MADASARTLPPVRPIDRDRIDWRGVVLSRCAHWLGHDPKSSACSVPRSDPEESVRRDFLAADAHTCTVQTPEPFPPPPLEEPEDEGARGFARDVAFGGLGERLAWVAGLVLALSAFTGWYSGSGEGATISVMGWHTGTLGKLIFFIGLATLVLVALREAGIDLPATVPESLVVIALGSLATIFALVRLISIPDDFFFAGRGIGIWITLVSAIGLIVAGLLQASEEL